MREKKKKVTKYIGRNKYEMEKVINLKYVFLCNGIRT